MIVGLDPKQAIPLLEVSEIVQFVIVGLDPRQAIPPTKLPENVHVVIVGEEKYEQ